MSKPETFMTGATNSGNEVDFAIDKNNRLYLNGERVKTDIKLDWYVLVPAWMAATGSCTIGLFSALSFFFK
ncbi:MAG: hypothetical protein NXI02_30550 [Rhodobacteraceae bacterium]|nr:hypothetical protein [Paracoccaceae bacterium]